MLSPLGSLHRPREDHDPAEDPDADHNGQGVCDPLAQGAKVTQTGPGAHQSARRSCAHSGEPCFMDADLSNGIGIAGGRGPRLLAL